MTNTPQTALGRRSSPSAALAEIARIMDRGWVSKALAQLTPFTSDATHAGEACVLMARAALAENDGARAATLLQLAHSVAKPKLKHKLRLGYAELLHRQRRVDEAVPELTAVAAACRGSDPITAARALAGLAEIQLARHQPDAALEALRTAVRLDGENILAWVMLAEQHLRRGDNPNALAAVQRALRPDLVNVALIARIAAVLFDLGQMKEGEAACELALKIAPDTAGLHNMIGISNLRGGKCGEAMARFERVIDLDPGCVAAHCNLGLAYHEQTRFDDAEAAYRQALTLDPDFEKARLNLLLMRHYDPRFDGAAIRAEAERMMAPLAAAVASRHAVTAGPRDLDPERRLRVGYVSGDFRTHPVGFFIEAVLGAHDPAAVELFCYSAGVVDDAVTARLKRLVPNWRWITHQSDDEADALIHADRIDLLIDLSGFTERNRMPLFARKPAPVQATWLGYFGTLGLPAIDYIIADRHVLPVEDEPHYTETPLRLPDSYLCFTPPDIDVPVGPLPAQAGRPFTFGCFNNLTKVNERVIALWGEILSARPESRLMIKTKQTGDPAIRDRLATAFAARGVAAERLLFSPPGPRAELLAAYNEVDLALDPFPFGGGTTTVEALWMGVPTVTLRGDRFVGRVSTSVLSAVGIADDFVTADADRYRETALAFAADLPRLAAVRAGLRERMLASPLCDAPRFARHLELTYRTMWRRWCAVAATYPETKP
jgi:predicted O-linked N-acetylglucosamine transferase (SPINDLY family)